jgi:hypothetical protein
MDAELPAIASYLQHRPSINACQFVANRLQVNGIKDWL